VSNPTHVVFDLGNVLITWDRELLYRQLIEDPEERRHFLDNVLTLEANAELDRGMSLADLTAMLTNQHPEYAKLLDAFRTRWIETIGGAIDGSVSILSELRTMGTPLYALSNWGAETFEQTVGQYGFLNWFDGRVISGFEGTVKPDARIFEILLERFGLTATSCLFIDDSQQNVDAAARIGFDTIRFADPPSLRSELIERGLLPDPPSR